MYKKKINLRSKKKYFKERGKRITKKVKDGVINSKANGIHILMPIVTAKTFETIK